MRAVRLFSGVMLLQAGQDDAGSWPERRSLKSPSAIRLPRRREALRGRRAVLADEQGRAVACMLPEEYRTN
jgi:hypothetical protein